VSDTTGDAQDRYISIFEAARILRVSLERITWFIATVQISSIKNPRNKSDKLVSLRDVHRLRNSPHLLARQIIYTLIDPLYNTVRYVGQTSEPQTRFLQHMNADSSNPAKDKWIRTLKKKGLQPRLEVLEGVDGPAEAVNDREWYWIEYFVSKGAKLTNILINTYATAPHATARLVIDGEEWVTLKEAVERLRGENIKADHHKISRLVNKGIVQARDNPLDTRVRLVNFHELRAVFKEYSK